LSTAWPIGKFHGVMAATTPTGARSRVEPPDRSCHGNASANSSYAANLDSGYRT
jgi:hypothetical protein